ncbi:MULTISPECIES: hypothetical protein [Priestia]|uniref:hypothetical protein n=1 Tax=Priestia TaxID=2800373 RepID=UPI002D8024FD|nr:hypothetical protein [Priestia megaterium]MEB4872139.1 diadenylate cyclase [Priestia megaterium]
MEVELPWEADQKQKDVIEFFKKVQELLNQYSNVKIKPSYNNNEGKIGINLKVSTGVNLPKFIIEEFAMQPLYRAFDLIFKHFKTDDTINYDILQTITRDVSLSFIFEKYLEADKSTQYSYIKMVNELKNIGAKTYENSPVNIGVIYCENDLDKENLKLLDVDIISLSKKKPLQRFFLEEKPLLKLIDNQSLIIVVDNQFDVFAILRKKSEGKSLSYLLESQFNSWAINEMNKHILQEITDNIAKRYMKKGDPIPLTNTAEQIIEKILTTSNSIESKRPPSYIYFAVRDKEINIFTKQKFVISYANGDWQLKHYNFMLGIIMKSVFVNNIVQLIRFNHQNSEKLIGELTEAVMKLYNIIKIISQNNKSSIFIISLDTDHFNSLSYSNARQILKENGFKQNNLNQDYMNVIKDGKNHSNIKDLDQYLIQSLAAIDGAVILDKCLNIVSFGEIISIPASTEYKETFGTGTKAARYASKMGIAIKISEDGDICIFDNEKLLLKI